MSYKACFECELVFEVDDGTHECPECQGSLEAYQPESDELDPGTSDSAFDTEEPTRTLSEQTDDARAAGERPTAMLDAAAIRANLAKVNAAQAPAPETPAGSEETRMLSIPEEVLRIERNPALERTKAIPMAEAKGPQPLPPLARRKPKDRRSVYGVTGPDDSDSNSAPRHTRVAEVAGEGVGAEPARPATPRPVAPRPVAPARKTPRPTSPNSAPNSAPRTTQPAAPLAPLTPVTAGRRRTVPRGLLIGGAAAVVGLVVTLALIFSGGEPPQTEPDAAPPPPPKSWAATLSAELQGAVAYLPRLSGIPKIEEGAYIAGGPEGFSSSFGTIVGLPSTTITSGIIDSDGDGEWARPLRSALERLKPADERPLGMAFDAEMPARDFLRLATAAERAGRDQLQVLIAREDGQDEIGAIPFRVHRPSSRLPAGGAVIARIGQLGFNVTVKDGTGQIISQGAALIERRRKALDYISFDARLQALRDAHPSVQTIIVVPIPETPLEQLAIVLAKAAFDSNERPRFPDIRVAVR